MIFLSQTKPNKLENLCVLNRDLTERYSTPLGRRRVFTQPRPSGDIDGPPNRQVPQPLPRANPRSCDALS